MKRGQEVYIIAKGTVLKCVVIGTKDGIIEMRYQVGNFKKTYKRPVGQVATQIERETNGIQGSSNSCHSESNNRRNVKNGGVCKPRISISDGESESSKVFVGAWGICNMA